MASSTNPRRTPPRYLDFRQATILREIVDQLVLRARLELERDGADPECLDHEIGIALARAACRLDLDLLNGSRATIERLEAVVAELGARLELAKMGNTVEGEARPRMDPLFDESKASAELAGADLHVAGLRCKCPRCR